MTRYAMRQDRIPPPPPTNGSSRARPRPNMAWVAGLLWASTFALFWCMVLGVVRCDVAAWAGLAFFFIAALRASILAALH